MSITNIDATAPPNAKHHVVRPGSPELAILISQIEAGAQARDRLDGDAHDAISLVRAAGLGLYRLPVKQGGGGGGASLLQLYELVLDLAAADSNVPHILRNHFAFIEKALRNPDSPQHQRWLDLAHDGQLAGLGASELGTQNVGDGDGQTELVPHGDGYLLTGTKYYSTGNLYADFILVNAKTPDGRFVSARVGTRQAGVSVADDWDGIGQRLTASGTTVYAQVRVHRDDVFFYADSTDVAPFQATFAQLYLTTIIAGILRSVVTDATLLVQQRARNYYHAVAVKPADDPLLQQTIGQLASAAYVAESAVLRAAATLDAAHRSAIAGHADDQAFLDAALQAAKAKVIVDELALTAASRLFDVGGASAAKQSKRLDRHWRNIRTIASHNPAAFKARVLGDHLVRGTALPNAAFF